VLVAELTAAVILPYLMRTQTVGLMPRWGFRILLIISGFDSLSSLSMTDGVIGWDVGDMDEENRTGH
jgi:hypothetical protein